MRRNIIEKPRFAGLIFIIFSFALKVAAQSAVAAREKEMVDGADERFWYTIAFIVVVALGFAVYFWRKSMKGAAQPQTNDANRYRDYYKNESYDMEGLDAEKELEWLRKAKKSSKPSTISFGAKAVAAKRERIASSNSAGIDEGNLETKLFQEKMRKLQYAQLPINSFNDVSPSKKYDSLPFSEDDSLLNAIEQANEEYEEDESVRDLAVRILTAFRTRNSVESLAQIALYDLSSNLRSKAVSTLTDFDHESVFETILLACADPTREVRAAASRGLFRLNFDRADAWKRIIETGDEFRMRHAARAAVEAGIVGKAFERLVHEDMKVSYEAFVLVALLIRSGETNEVYGGIRDHKDTRVKFALLHVLKAVKNERSLSGLNELLAGNTFPTDVTERITDTIKSFEAIPV